MANITHSCHLIAAEPQTVQEDGEYELHCDQCGYVWSYQGRWFTEVEARRHERYFTENNHPGREG